MNGPSSWTNATDYSTGTSDHCNNYPVNSGNHQTDCTSNSGNPVQHSNSNWVEMYGCNPGQFAFYYPKGTPNTPDPGAWADWSYNVSDIWEHYGYTTITAKNY